MKKIFEEYGGTIIAVIAVGLLLVILNIYFNPENGEMKERNAAYLDMIAGITEKGETCV